MLKKFGCAIAVMLVGSIALAETIRGVITEVKDDEITVMVRVKGEKKGEKKTFKIDAKKVKVMKMKGKDDSEDSTLTALKKAVEASTGRRKGAAAVLEVKDGKDTEIKYGGGRRKKKDI